ncbi:MAG: hypothetical protein KKG47_06730 [Proteobacteria bacterium]|nr:hypothetical protein [Pseudomonadota bacterium]MBU1739731.1 hypothetical protein [Pseudomonadota bacterium]
MRALNKKRKLSLLLSSVAFCSGLAFALSAQADWSVNDPFVVTNDCGALGTNCSGYANTQASFNDHHDKFPKMNNAGDIVWQGRPSGASSYDYEIFLKSAASGLIEQITADSNYDSSPTINDLGEVSWMSYDGSAWNVNLYSGGTTSNISAPTPLEPWPRINNLGEVAWIHVDGNDYEIKLYSGGTETQVTDNDTNDVQIRINDNGDLMWRGRGDLQADLSYDIYTRIGGGGITQVTQDDLLDWSPQLSNTGHLVWLSYDGAQCDVVVKRAGDATPTQITSTPAEDHNPVINDAGIVAWQSFDGNDWEIFTYSGDTITQLTDNDFDDVTPQINSAGEIAWFAFGGDIGVYLFEPDTGTVSKLSESYTGHYDSVPDINDQGKVVWSGFDGTDFEIIVAEPPGGIHDDVYFYPYTLNLRSHGKKFKAVIDLPLPHSAEFIDPKTVAITMISPANSLAEPLPEPLYSNGGGRVGDSDGNGLVDITVNFDRQALIALIEPLGVLGEFKLSIAGNMYTGDQYPGNQYNGEVITGVNSVMVVDREMKEFKKERTKFRKHSKCTRKREVRDHDPGDRKEVNERYAKLGKKVMKGLKKKKR